MFEILSFIAIAGIIGISSFIYLRWRAEAKSEGIVSDEYIENNEDKEV